MPSGRNYPRILAIISGVGLTLFLLNGWMSYRDWRAFPKNEKSFMSKLIANGKMLHCDPALSEERNYDPETLKRCFLESEVEKEEVDVSGNDFGGIFTQDRRCEIDGFAAKFRIYMLRNDYRIWCQYRTAQSIAQFKDLPEMQMAVYDSDADFLTTVFIKLFGERDRSARN